MLSAGVGEYFRWNHETDPPRQIVEMVFLEMLKAAPRPPQEAFALSPSYVESQSDAAQPAEPSAEPTTRKVHAFDAHEVEPTATDDLERWGNADTDDVGRKSGWHQRADGYWTPWHMAFAALQRQAREISELRGMQERNEGRIKAIVDDALLLRAERAEAECDALRECVRELVACADESDSLAAERLYGKPHTPEYKTRELDHRQRSIEAWKAARAKVRT